MKRSGLLTALAMVWVSCGLCWAPTGVAAAGAGCKTAGTAEPDAVARLRTGLIVVDQSGGEAGWVTQVLDTIASWASDEQEQEQDGRVRVEAMSRGGESTRLAMPLLANFGRQTVLAGSRRLQLTWVGGRRPFLVVITGPSGAAAATWQATDRRVAGGTVELEEGLYEVRVTDSVGGSVIGDFEVTADRPALDEARINALPATVRMPMSAALLAGVDDGAWRLEAYEQLAAKPDDAAARVVAEWLVQGRSLEELRRLMPAGH